MKKTGVLKVVNLILGIFFVNQVVTGLIHARLSHNMYEILHEGGGIILALSGVLHLILNWNWINSNYLRKSAATKA
ncbi:MAG: hypothetical protein JW814_07605 [Candidatus Krumholzibacteriota bacterium]|nr:hypothetical protein [Candidatus Krumholzibacteriota bacterium]